MDLQTQRKKNISENMAILAELKKEIPVSDAYMRKIQRPKIKKKRLLDRPRRWLPRKAKENSRYEIDNGACRRKSRILTDITPPVSLEQSQNKMVVNFAFLRRTGNKMDPVEDEDFSMLDDDDSDCNQSSTSLRRKRQSSLVSKQVTDITEQDLDMVANVFSDKCYDTTNGTSCHQCRQKTIDQKTICHSEDCLGARGQFCGPCLRIRYGEDARLSLKDPDWLCPPCRGICNCSICRRRSGRRSTGILIHTARTLGFEDVNSFLSGSK